MKIAYGIAYAANEEEEPLLPHELEIPDEINDDYDTIANYIYDKTKFVATSFLIAYC